jgi:hypothetical protein
MATKAFLEKAYLAYFGRPVDSTGLTDYASSTDAQVADAFAASAESKALYGSTFNFAQINAIYLALFNREAEKAGLEYWYAKVADKTFTPAGAAIAILNGALNADKIAVENKLAASAAFTAALDTAPEMIGYSGDAAAASARSFLSTITATAATAAAVDAAIVSVVAARTAVPAQTFTLTTGLDNFTGTSGNDTFQGDFSASTFNAGDSIIGGAGTDTLKMFGTYAAASMPISITGVENLVLAVAADAALDFTLFNKAGTGIEKVQIDNATLLNAKTITTTAGQSLSLATGSGSAVTAGTVTWAASATDTTANLILNGYQAVAGGTAAALTVTGAATKTLNIASTGGANKTGTFTGPTTVTSHVITGDKALTYTLAAADAAALNSINASAATGAVNVTVSAAANKAGFTFTGGTGNDTIKLADDQLATFTAGTQLAGGDGTGDKIGILDTALTAGEYAKINAATGFEVLGLNAAITLDASALTSIKKFSIDTTGLTQVINKLATGSTTTVTTGTPTSLTLATDVGITDTSFAIGSATTTGLTVTALVTTGIASVALASNGTAGSTNTITTLTNSANSAFTVTGSAGLTITNPIGVAISRIDASALTGALTVIGSSGIDVLIGGSGADSITAGAAAGDGVDTVTGNGGIDTFIYSTTDIDTTAGAVTEIITDFTTAVDKISLTVVGAAGSVTNYVEATSAAADLATLLTAAGIALDGTVKIYVGQVGSDSYVVTDPTDGTGYTDVIKLTGVALTGVAMTDFFA